VKSKCQSVKDNSLLASLLFDRAFLHGTGFELQRIEVVVSKV
jgi:hypothetical protein